MKIDLEIFKKPNPFSKDTKPFWDDVHISKHMLRAHLDETHDAASRQPHKMDAACQFLYDHYPPNEYPKVLDLGCGPGLLTKRLLEKGYDAYGVDVSSRSIAYAKDHFGESYFERQDYLSLTLKQRYDLVILMYCDYAVLSAEDRKRLCQNIRKVLKKDGIFVFDVFTKERFKNREERKSWLYQSQGFFSPNPHLLLEAFYRYKAGLFLEQFIIMEEDTLDVIYNWHQTYDLNHIKTELNDHHFKVLKHYADVTGKAYHQDSETLYLVTKKA